MDLAAALASLTDLKSDEGLASIAHFLRLVSEESPAATVPDLLAAVQSALAERSAPVEQSLVDLDFDEGWGDFNWSTEPAA